MSKNLQGAGQIQTPTQLVRLPVLMHGCAGPSIPGREVLPVGRELHRS
jgi:hypothetical protein